ncbi:MAG: prepilin peptidase [Deltaproteobacteria bacterium]|nr:prepilin peptidase [Deltaproteobacteria bacterium]
MSDAPLRPGIAQGVYPERRDIDDGRIERAIHAARGYAASWRQLGRSRLEAFVRSVDDAGAELKTETEAGLRSRTRDLRNDLVMQGLTDEQLVRVFALIREAAGRTIGMPHYGVQLMGGWAMARGMLVEMETGEGKTLTATLPACAAALAGIPVHVVSVNDYLVQRDADLMRPVYEALGLSVGTVTDAAKDEGLRRAAYACDVTYATSSQIAFDYLRDGLVRSRRPTPGSGGAGAQPLMRGLCFAVVDEADSVLIDEARTPLILSAGQGTAEQRATYKRALRLASALRRDEHFRADPRAGTVEMLGAGRERLVELARPLEGFWTGPRRREEWVVRALSALHLYRRDHHYLVREGKVEIIDGPTGRAAPDRSWSRGLHQLIEVKEGCEVSPERETIARISYQRFFRRYLRLAGMSGTVSEVSRELWSVYRLQVQEIPTRVEGRRLDGGTRVFVEGDDRWQSVVESVRKHRQAGRPVLVGTASLSASESLAERLDAAGVPHRVLNARQDAEEASIVAEAGAPGQVTVATHMAGRGTDICLGPGVAEAGGLHVIATQRAEAGRIDRQLYGRCSRQGDPGSFEALLALGDAPLLEYYPRRVWRLLARLARSGTPLPRIWGEWLTRLPQRAEERRHARMRRGLIELEDQMGDTLAFAGRGE